MERAGNSDSETHVKKLNRTSETDRSGKSLCCIFWDILYIMFTLNLKCASKTCLYIQLLEYPIPAPLLHITKTAVRSVTNVVVSALIALVRSLGDFFGFLCNCFWCSAKTKTTAKSNFRNKFRFFGFLVDHTAWAAPEGREGRSQAGPKGCYPEVGPLEGSLDF